MTLAILSKDNDLLGTDIYRDADKTNPMAYRHTVQMSVNANSAGTNNNVTVRSNLPVVNSVDGVVSSKDSFLMVTKFSSLQHVVADAERAQIFDDHVAFLIRARDTILDGQLPSDPLSLSYTSIDLT